MSSSEEGRVEAVAPSTLQKFLPAITTLAIFGAGMAALLIHVGLGDQAPAGLSRGLFQLVPAVVPLAAGVAAGIAVRLWQRCDCRSRELQAANQALEELNERLQFEANSAVQSEKRFHALFSSNPCPMWILECDTLAITDANEAALRQ
jgi:hypothetical protein